MSDLEDQKQSAPDSSTVSIVALVIAVAVVFAAATLAIYAADPGMLWRDLSWDRNSHFRFGLDLAIALKRLDIVWTSETIAKLFEIGPTHYTPGTKMPEQRIGSPEDRSALIRFLERATK